MLQKKRKRSESASEDEPETRKRLKAPDEHGPNLQLQLVHRSGLWLAQQVALPPWLLIRAPKQVDHARELRKQRDGQFLMRFMQTGIPVVPSHNLYEQEREAVRSPDMGASGYDGVARDDVAEQVPFEAAAQAQANAGTGTVVSLTGDPSAGPVIHSAFSETHQSSLHTRSALQRGMSAQNDTDPAPPTVPPRPVSRRLQRYDPEQEGCESRHGSAAEVQGAPTLPGAVPAHCSPADWRLPSRMERHQRQGYPDDSLEQLAQEEYFVANQGQAADAPTQSQDYEPQVVPPDGPRGVSAIRPSQPGHFLPSAPPSPAPRQEHQHQQSDAQQYFAQLAEGYQFYGNEGQVPDGPPQSLQLAVQPPLPPSQPGPAPPPLPPPPAPQQEYQYEQRDAQLNYEQLAQGYQFGQMFDAAPQSLQLAVQPPRPPSQPGPAPPPLPPPPAPQQEYQHEQRDAQLNYEQLAQGYQSYGNEGQVPDAPPQSLQHAVQSPLPPSQPGPARPPPPPPPPAPPQELQYHQGFPQRNFEQMAQDQHFVTNQGQMFDAPVLSQQHAPQVLRPDIPRGDAVFQPSRPPSQPGPAPPPPPPPPPPPAPRQERQYQQGFPEQTCEQLAQDQHFATNRGQILDAPFQSLQHALQAPRPPPQPGLALPPPPRPRQEYQYQQSDAQQKHEQLAQGYQFGQAADAPPQSLQYAGRLSRPPSHSGPALPPPPPPQEHRHQHGHTQQSFDRSPQGQHSWEAAIGGQGQTVYTSPQGHEYTLPAQAALRYIPRRRVVEPQMQPTHSGGVPPPPPPPMQQYRYQQGYPQQTISQLARGQQFVRHTSIFDALFNTTQSQAGIGDQGQMVYLSPMGHEYELPAQAAIRYIPPAHLAIEAQTHRTQFGRVPPSPLSPARQHAYQQGYPLQQASEQVAQGQPPAAMENPDQMVYASPLNNEVLDHLGEPPSLSPPQQPHQQPRNRRRQQIAQDVQPDWPLGALQSQEQRHSQQQRRSTPRYQLEGQLPRGSQFADHAASTAQRQTPFPSTHHQQATPSRSRSSSQYSRAGTRVVVLPVPSSLTPIDGAGRPTDRPMTGFSADITNSDSPIAGVGPVAGRAAAPLVQPQQQRHRAPGVQQTPQAAAPQSIPIPTANRPYNYQRRRNSPPPPVIGFSNPHTRVSKDGPTKKLHHYVRVMMKQLLNFGTRKKFRRPHPPADIHTIAAFLQGGDGPDLMNLQLDLVTTASGVGSQWNIDAGTQFAHEFLRRVRHGHFPEGSMNPGDLNVDNIRSLFLDRIRYIMFLYQKLYFPRQPSEVRISEALNRMASRRSTVSRAVLSHPT
ncbi:hypothetical protein AURDEDRAFT_128884 [Auricularia subglabra TFB-10046 SS5]|nr:hypothetical protein AURDEDRAFT_128884 [Auricularia subglabra TFB-10046 SS5]